jgi:hypothetical protein
LISSQLHHFLFFFFHNCSIAIQILIRKKKHQYWFFWNFQSLILFSKISTFSLYRILQGSLQ